MTSLPSVFYYGIGILILTNIGSIMSLFFVAIKVTWWAATFKTETIEQIKDAKSCAVRAHERVDKIDKTISKGDIS